MASKAHQRRVPLRTCVVCGTRATKTDLIRLVASKNGAVHVDATARLPGRGVYLCKDAACRRDGLKRGRLEYSLRASIDDESWNGLLPAIESTIKGGREQATR